MADTQPAALSFVFWHLVLIYVAIYWEMISPYWNRGVFDPLDLIATVVGGLSALTILTYSPKGHDNEQL